MAFETSRLTVTSETFLTQVQYDLASQINCAFAAFDLAKHLRVDQIGLVELEICCRTARIEPITKNTHTQIRHHMCSIDSNVPDVPGYHC